MAAGLGLVESGVGSAIVVHGGCRCWPWWRGEELLAVSWRMRAFCVAGGEELLAVSWREGFAVEMGGHEFVWNVARNKIKRKLGFKGMVSGDHGKGEWKIEGWCSCVLKTVSKTFFSWIETD